MKKFILFLSIILVLALVGCKGKAVEENVDAEVLIKSVSAANANSKYKEINAVVNRVIDGDTIEVMIDDKKTSIRLLLVDTPETKKPKTPVQPWGTEASDFLKKTLTGKTVKLEMQSNLDKYGRGLAYVYLDNKSIQEQLLSKGLARVAYVYVKNPPHLKEYQDKENAAKKEKLNIWSVDGYVKDDGFHPEVVKKAS